MAPRNTDTPLLIAGLGNPGGEYARNRHNAGFMAVDVIHDSHDFGAVAVEVPGPDQRGQARPAQG